jgi:glycosyltransferase involved in cell wall biosynthesis
MKSTTKQAPLHKVMHVVQFLEIGGLETVVIELCRRVDHSRFEPEILCLCGYDPKYAAVLTAEGVKIHVMPKKHRYDFFYFFRVALFLRARKIETLHAHSGCFFYAALFFLLGGIKRFLFTAHGLPVQERLQDRIEDSVAGVLCRTLVAVSDEIKGSLASRMPLSKGKIQVIYNGVDTERFRPFVSSDEATQIARRYSLPEDSFIIGSVGRLEPVKNLAMLLHAFAHLMQTGARDAHLILVGEGSERHQLEQMADDLGLAGHISFLGMQYNIHEIVPLFDVFVLSSLSEGTSISLLEAQSCGVPAVVTNVGGNSFIIRNAENGFLCELNDVPGMSAAFMRLRNEKDLAQKMGKAARARVVDGLDYGSMTRKYEKIYQQ